MYEWCMIECESVMVDKVLMYMDKSIVQRTEPRGRPEFTESRTII